MALFKDFSDKKLTFLPQTRYRCLYLDDLKPRMLVFDKSVLRGDLMSLVGVVAQEDKDAARALLDKKSKLRSGVITSDGKVHTLTFVQEVKPEDVKSKLKKINATAGAKINVVVDAGEEEQEAPKQTVNPLEERLVTRTQSEDDLPSKDDGGTDAPKGRGRSNSTSATKTASAGEALEKLEGVLEAWRLKNGDPPAPPEDEETAQKWMKRLGEIADAAKSLRAFHKKDFTAKEAERARDLEDDARVLQSRVALLQKKGSYKPVDVKPILAWSWCSAHVKRGALLDVLKAVLVPYEAAIKAFHKAPSEKSLAAAKKLQERLVGALEKVETHYADKGGDDVQKLNVTRLLLQDAKEQAQVLARLEQSLGDLDPKVCAKEGAKVLDASVPTVKELDDTLDQARTKAENSYQTSIGSRRTQRDNFIRGYERRRDESLLAADQLGTEAEQNEARAKALEIFAADKKRSEDGCEEQCGYDKEKRDKANTEATQKRAAEGFAWASLSTVLDPALPLHKALAKPFAAYEKALATLRKDATAEHHAAAWKALQAVEKAIASGDKDTIARSKKEKDTAAKAKLDAESLFADEIQARLLKEKTRLEAVEMELPQGKLAKTLAQSEDGRRTLDAWVEELGGKAGSDEDKALVRTAMRARFDITRLDGEMTTKALPKLYKYLTLVPEKHVRENDKLKRVLRNRKTVPDGFYAIEDDGTDGLISMDMPRTGNSGVVKQLFGALLPVVEKPQGGWKGSGVKKSEAKIIFSHLTLHEVGHAMDEKLGFMDARLGNAKYGGWQKQTAQDLRTVAGDKLGFYAALKDVTVKQGETVTAAKHLGNDDDARKAFLDTYLQHLQKRTDPAKEMAKAAEKFTVDFDALAKHKGALFIVASRLKPGAMQQVQQWDRKAETAVVGGRVYQEAYEGVYWSYDVSARSRGIGGYQFRAPGEWFSEIYACYYGGRLKSDHPDYAWVHALVENK